MLEKRATSTHTPMYVEVKRRRRRRCLLSGSAFSDRLPDDRYIRTPSPKGSLRKTLRSTSATAQHQNPACMYTPVLLKILLSLLSLSCLYRQPTLVCLPSSPLALTSSLSGILFLFSTPPLPSAPPAPARNRALPVHSRPRKKKKILGALVKSISRQAQEGSPRRKKREQERRKEQ